MRSTSKLSVRARFAAVAAITGMVVLGVTVPASAGPRSSSAPKTAHRTSTPKTTPLKTTPNTPATGAEALCGSVPAGHSRCFSLRRTGLVTHKGAQPAIVPSGYGPADLSDAYGIPAAGGAGETVAIVDAFDDPSAEADLAIYRSQYGLPACTTANGCFSKVDQRGGTVYPAPDAGWAGEISLDVDMVSAIAPAAHIVLVEADDNSNDNLGAAVDEAVALGAKYVSNSYGSGYDATPGSGEDPSEVTDLDPYYNHPGVAIAASSGDSAYGVSYPAASQYVTSVGGTSLERDASTRGWSESVWDNSFGGPGSGCSLYEAKPSWQTDSGCGNRMVTDVSAVADPDTGVAVYDTYQAGGWDVFGGTSASSPIIAGVFADAGQPAVGTYPASYPYARTGQLNDVTSGANGLCTPAYYCTAQTGYDGPTGLGTPHGLAAFSSGPYGTVTGTVTDTHNANPIAGATVTVGTTPTTTNSAGQYSVAVPAGTYDISATKFGYTTVTRSAVDVPDGSSITEDFTLATVSTVTLSGTVRDASGHGWPLYAAITIDGVPGGPVYTNPFTGHYSVTLPQGATYQLHVGAVSPGYQSVTQGVPVAGANVVHNIGVPIDAASCTAPGYAAVRPGPVQTFDGGATPPGWTVTNNTAAGGWQFDDPKPRGNLTGGTGGFAIVDSDFLGSGNTEDTYLTSPVTDLSSSVSPDLTFASDYHDLSSTADVDLSTDGGATWTNIWERSGVDARGPAQVDVPLPQAAGKSQVQVRFHYTGTWAWWWEIDNVYLGDHSCTLTPGGLVSGFVTDKNTHAGLVGATVSSVDDPTDTTTSIATANDSKIADGFYSLFSSLTGSHPISATAPLYGVTTTTVQVTANKIARVQFALPTGRVVVPRARVVKTLKAGTTWSTIVTIRNTGTAPADVTVAEDTDTDWVAEAPTSFTLAPGASAPMTVTLNAGAPSVTKVGNYVAFLDVTSDNTPYAVPAIAVLMTVKAAHSGH